VSSIRNRSIDRSDLASAIGNGLPTMGDIGAFEAVMIPIHQGEGDRESEKEEF
jgi:hypothetical protein